MLGPGRSSHRWIQETGDISLPGDPRYSCNFTLRFNMDTKETRVTFVQLNPRQTAEMMPETTGHRVPDSPRDTERYRHSIRRSYFQRHRELHMGRCSGETRSSHRWILPITWHATAQTRPCFLQRLQSHPCHIEVDQE